MSKPLRPFHLLPAAAAAALALSATPAHAAGEEEPVDDSGDDLPGGEEDGEGKEGEGEQGGRRSGGPDIQREGDEDDVENWTLEGEQKVEEKKVEEKKKKELPPEPSRSGNSGNWYEVTVDCGSCPNLLGQKLGIEDPLVMREFYDYVQIASDRKSAKFVYPSIGQNRPMGIADKGSRVLLWQYILDTGSRLTDTYAYVWDLELKASGGLLYGRKYEVQAWTDAAYEDWEKGYRSKDSFISYSKLVSYAELAPVKGLTTEQARFQVGEDSRINFVGYAAFARSDVSIAAVEAEQEALKAAAEAEAKRLRDQKDWYKKGQKLIDEKEYSEALGSLLESRKLGFQSLDLHSDLGYVYYMLKDYENALKEYGAVLAVDPRDTEIRYNVARIYEKQKKWDEAIKEYQAILKFNPDDQGARERLELLRAARDMVGGQ
jgi:tetratricopeptide (TPR) repeat protein